jgi:pimeloyl-ACP methyl ester carboxylesterase
MLTAGSLEFEVPFQRTVLLGNRRTPHGATRSAILLHGGGTSAADGFEELRTFLHAQGVETLAFDCVGHGRTGGQQLGTTLHERVQQVHAVITSQNLEPSVLTLIGFSMGAYVAVKAAAEIGVPRLCLAIPAAYTAQAYKTPFGPEFSQILRTPRSWETSDAFDLIRNYTGHLLVVSAEEDRIVPAEIPQRYATTRTNRRSTVHHVIKGSGHNLSEHYERDPQARMAAYTEIASLCQRGDA